LLGMVIKEEVVDEVRVSMGVEVDKVIMGVEGVEAVIMVGRGELTLVVVKKIPRLVSAAWRRRSA